MERPFSHLAIVGASARAAVGSVYLSGRTALAADLFADADLRQLCPVAQIEDYPAGLVDWLQHIECDAWMYTGALENHPELVDELAGIRPLVGNVGDTLRRVRDPLLLQQVFHDRGLPFPETHAADEDVQLEGDWLVKSYTGSSGSGVASEVPLPRGERLGEGENPGTGLPSPSPSLKGRGTVVPQGYVQRSIPGVPCAAIFSGDTLLGVSRQLVGEPWTGADEFQYCGSIAPWPLENKSKAVLEEIGRTLVAEFQLQGLYGVDFILDGTDVWPVEVNPRYTASIEMIELAHGLQAIDWHLSTCTTTGLPRLPALGEQSTATCLGKVIWFARRPLVISELTSSWALAQRDLSDIPTPGTEINIGEPVLTIRAESWTPDETLATLHERMHDLESRFTQ